MGDPDAVSRGVEQFFHLYVDPLSLSIIHGDQALAVEGVELLTAPALPVPYPYLIAREPHSGPGGVWLHGVVIGEELHVFAFLTCADDPEAAGVHRIDRQVDARVFQVLLRDLCPRAVFGGILEIDA